MIYSYCKRCKTESAGDVCRGCGRRATAAAQRDVWSVASVPIADGRIWRAALYTLLAVTALLFLMIFGLETLLSGSTKTAQMWNSALPSCIFALLPVGLALTFIDLMLQGREVIVFILDPQGAHLQTWHAPSKLKSWARLQSASPENDVPQQFIRCHQSFWVNFRHVRTLESDCFLLDSGLRIPISRTCRAAAREQFFALLR